MNDEQHCGEVPSDVTEAEGQSLFHQTVGFESCTWSLKRVCVFKHLACCFGHPPDRGPSHLITQLDKTGERDNVLFLYIFSFFLFYFTIYSKTSWCNLPETLGLQFVRNYSVFIIQFYSYSDKTYSVNPQWIHNTSSIFSSNKHPYTVVIHIQKKK